MTLDSTATDKKLYCVHCEGEIKGDAWYAGKFVTYTHQDGGKFMCNPLDFTNNNHAEVISN